MTDDDGISEYDPLELLEAFSSTESAGRDELPAPPPGVAAPVTAVVRRPAPPARKGERAGAAVRRPSLRAADFSESLIENMVPPPESLQAKALGGPGLGWNIAAVRSVHLTSGIFTTMPKICDPDSCLVARCGLCPIENREHWRGQNCPVDMVEAFKQFANYVQELQIQPGDHTDLMLVADLVSFHMQERQIQFELKFEEMKQNQVGGVDQRSGKVYYNRVANPHIKSLADLRKRRHEIYDKLIASRDAKRKAEASQGTKKFDPFAMMEELYQDADDDGDAEVVEDPIPTPAPAPATAPRPPASSPSPPPAATSTFAAAWGAPVRMTDHSPSVVGPTPGATPHTEEEFVDWALEDDPED